MEKLEKYSDQFIEMIMNYAPNVLLAIVTLIAGLWLIRILVRSLNRLMLKKNVDESLRPFFKSLLNIGLKIILVISVISILGVETTSFIAVLGAAGLAIGLALQGSLANFAGGVLILLLKPFKVGDFISSGSDSGTVQAIQIFYTYIVTIQNQQVTIPNGQLANNTITNYSSFDTRRFDLTFGIGYDEDMDKAKGILKRLIEDDERILKDPEPILFIEALADSSVNIRMRGWSSNDDYWDIVNNMNEKVKKSFDREGISIPYPQRDVHMAQQ